MNLKHHDSRHSLLRDLLFLQRQILPEHDVNPQVRVWDGELASVKAQCLRDRLVRVVRGIQKPVNLVHPGSCRDAVSVLQAAPPLPVQPGPRGHHLEWFQLLRTRLVLLVGNVLKGLRSYAERIRANLRFSGYIHRIKNNTSYLMDWFKDIWRVRTCLDLIQGCMLAALHSLEPIMLMLRYYVILQ